MNGDSEEDEGHRRHHPHRAKRRKYKVVIHSSPFLRCLQTSVAISAGMAQFQGTTNPNIHPTPMKHAFHSGSPHIRTIDHGRSTLLSAIPEPEATATSGKGGGQASKISEARTLLRVDAFLGEWLSPEYFDKITPPPESKLMVAAAKAELLRRGEPVDQVHTSSGHFPGGWGSAALANTNVEAADDHTPLDDLSELSQSLPRFNRANSHSMGLPTKRSHLNVTSKVEGSSIRGRISYVPPTPSYAISPSQPIPKGYVAHARDACVKVDYQWDSLRPPLEWGNGGDYGEEWSSMHKRFRQGLQEMISWYRNHDPIALARTLSEGLPENGISEDPDDEETDTVLILVTHGAGCNALIGALTSQPVLLDVGMASLTMAMRKTIEYRRVTSPSAPSPQTSPSRRRYSGFDTGISDDYEVKMIASTEHLRPGSKFLPAGQLQRTSTLPVREKSPYRYEKPTFADHHHKKTPTVDEDDYFESDSDGAAPAKKANFVEAKRSATTSAPSSNGGGLWSRPAPSDLGKEVEETKHPVKIPTPQLDGLAESRMNDSHGQPNGLTTNGNNTENEPLNGVPKDDSQGRSIAPSGLWGAPPQALATERDTGSKRRWTLSPAG